MDGIAINNKGNGSDISTACSIPQGFTKGKIFGSKEYLLKNLFTKLYNQGLRLLTKIRKDMENHLLAIENTA
ncbi:MAG: hypothetical protein MTP17_01695 [Candidatus Midichloria sp.]|nr:MAG: hypothetical protein MTP17_03605 [Candidatus Midichloria sp.]WHQ46637.1 MAG: hypothetical protein MTP17_04000 [Candidatus Midichloria sp.]WHQ47064.1 MAG: hypothetical protein MTP17_01695 [Candidatus Midichloria sp.]